MINRGTFTVKLENKGAVTLRDSDYLAQGGEGTIYKTGDTIIKLYADPKKMQRDDMAGKVKLLSHQLSSLTNIVAPQGIVTESDKPAGFYMPFVKGEPMARFFTNDHRQRAGFKDKDAVSVAEVMHNITNFAHKNKALMVDANELNWLIAGKNKPVVIDVDSWAIGKWPASVIMPSIRDWQHPQKFDTLTDWFAWGIVTFQLFTGIHPYKGKHTTYKPGDLMKRMQDMASVFHKDVRLPAAVRDFSCIPGPLLDWYNVTFSSVYRSIPPSPLLTGAPAKAALTMRATTTTTASALIFEKLFERPANDVLHVWANGAAYLAKNGTIVDLATGQDQIARMAPGCQIVRCGAGWLVVDADHWFYSIFDGIVTPISAPFAFNSVFVANETIYAVTDRELVEIGLWNADTKPVITASKRWQILPNSTQFFDNVAVMDALGAAFVLLPNESGMHQMRVKHLDNAKIVSAKANGRFAAFIVLDKDGSYQKIELTFGKTYTSYQAWIGTADTAELNMAVLPRGVVATIVNDFELAIVVPTTGAVNKLASKDVTTALKLANWGEKLVYIKDGAVWQMRM